MKILGPEPSLEAASRQSLIKINTMVDATSDPWNHAMFANWRDHYWGEVMGDLDAIMATLSPDPIYRFYGSSLFGPMQEMNTTEAVRAMYGGAIDMGYRLAGPISQLLVAFADLGLMLQFQLTCVYPGAMLHLADREIDPSAAYRVTFRVSESHPYDRATGLMGGEIVFMSAAEKVERIER